MVVDLPSIDLIIMGNSATIVTEMLIKSACGHAFPVICLYREYIDKIWVCSWKDIQGFLP